VLHSATFDREEKDSYETGSIQFTVHFVEEAADNFPNRTSRGGTDVQFDR